MNVSAAGIISPTSSGQQEAFAEVSQENARLRAQLEILKSEYRELRQENTRLSAYLSEAHAEFRVASTCFVEKFGVLWKLEGREPVEPTAYCPDDLAPLVPFPPDSQAFLHCQSCGFLAREINPRDVPSMAAKIRPLSRRRAHERQHRPTLGA